MKSKSDLELELDWSLEYKNRAERRSNLAIVRALKWAVPSLIFVAIILFFPVAKWFIIAGGIVSLSPLAFNLLLFSLNEILVLKHSINSDRLKKRINEEEQYEIVQEILNESTKRIEQKKQSKKVKNHKNDNDNNLTF